MMMKKLPPKSIIYNNEIVLRPFSPVDGAVIFQAVQESEKDLKKFMFWAHYPMDLAGANEIYAQFQAKTLLGEEAHFAGFDVDSGDCLFCASLVSGSRLNESALEIGYWVSSRYKGQGKGTLAAQILTVLAFRYYQADRLSVSCNPENIGSLRVIEKCGFIEEGVLRHFLQEPTQEMIMNGYSEERSALVFSLIPSDLSKLKWFEALSQELVFHHYSEREQKSLRT